MLALSFPFYDIWIFAWLSLILILYQIALIPPSQTFLRGWLFAFASFLISLAWVTNSMMEYGGLSRWTSMILLSFLAGYCAIYPAGAFTLSAYLKLHLNYSWFITLPFTWVAGEYLRAHLMTGFPWNSLGQSQHSVLILLQNADWGSFYGISFIIVAVGCAGSGLFLPSQNMHWRRELVIAGIMLGMMLLYGFFRTTQPETGPSCRVTIVQGNVDLNMKWDPANIDKILDDHIVLTQSQLPQNPDIIVWSESALPLYYRYAWNYSKDVNQSPGFKIQKLVSQAKAPIIAGTLDRLNDHVFNSAVFISPEGFEQYYNKEHLVPFGEYVPLSRILFFVNRMVQESIGDFVPGNSPEPFRHPKASIAMTICYENIFPDLVRERVCRNADMICNITNDAWFGRSSAAYQHFSASRFRSVETRRPVIRSANTGFSGAVDTRGRILTQSTLFDATALTSDVHLGNETSFYLLFGDIFAQACLVISCCYGIMLVIYSKKRMKGDSYEHR